MRTLNEETLRRMEEYIRERQRKDGVSPSYRRIMHALGMSSLNLVQRYVLALENQGRIRPDLRLGEHRASEASGRGEKQNNPFGGGYRLRSAVLCRREYRGDLCAPGSHIREGRVVYASYTRRQHDRCWDQRGRSHSGAKTEYCGRRADRCGAYRRRGNAETAIPQERENRASSREQADAGYRHGELRDTGRLGKLY